MSTWRIVRTGGRSGSVLPISDSTDDQLLGAGALDPVAVVAAGLPTLGEPLDERLPHPRVRRDQVLLARVERHEAGVDDDAVGIVDVELAPVVDREVGLDAQVPPEPWRHGLDAVERAGPCGDLEAGLLAHLARESLDEALTFVDHATWWAPVVAAVAAPVLHQQQPLGTEDDRTSDEPVAHAPSLAEPGRWVRA